MATFRLITPAAMEPITLSNAADHLLLTAAAAPYLSDLIERARATSRRSWTGN